MRDLVRRTDDQAGGILALLRDPLEGALDPLLDGGSLGAECSHLGLQLFLLLLEGVGALGQRVDLLLELLVLGEYALALGLVLLLLLGGYLLG